MHGLRCAGRHLACISQCSSAGLHPSYQHRTPPLGAAQVIISYTIKRYGALAFATVMTTRQFFSILVSSIVFWTPLMKGQW